eukprot:3297649-Ditylum_brightwellii.AAC.1
MCNQEGNLLSSALVEDEFHVQLARVQLAHPHLIDSSAHVAELYGILRSLQRGSNSRATDQGVVKESCNL